MEGREGEGRGGRKVEGRGLLPHLTQYHPSLLLCGKGLNMMIRKHGEQLWVEP